jgi:hypothetical protein
MENKRDKFVRIVEARTNKIINMIQLLGNCSNKRSYDYTEKDVNAVFTAIEKELKSAKLRFETTEEEKPSKFMLER